MPARFRDLARYPGCVSQVLLKADGTLVVDAHLWDDNYEHATTTYIAAGDVPALRAALAAHLQKEIRTDDDLLDLLATRFSGHLEIRKWIESVGVPFTYRYDDGAMLDP